MMQKVHAPEKSPNCQYRRRESAQFAPRGFSCRGEDGELDSGKQSNSYTDLDLNIIPIFPPIQAKLAINQPGDRYEEEANRTAEQVMHMPEPRIVNRSEMAQPLLMRRSCPKCKKNASERKEDDEERLQMKPLITPASHCVQTSSSNVPPIVHEVLRSPGRPLDAATRAFMEPRFGHDFSRVRVHEDTRAAESARAVNALAYTMGRDIVFDRRRYGTERREERRLMAHELTHVVQQGNSAPSFNQSQPRLASLANGGYTITVVPFLSDESDAFEREADAVSDQIAGMNVQSPSVMPTYFVPPLRRRHAGIQRYRVRLPRTVPLCGRALTHIDIEPPRWRDLEPCLPRSVPVYRINIVGRQVSPATTGLGRQIFNLHIGYYRDPSTGRLCAIADDSKMCLIGRCLILGCFPTLKEVLDAILKFLKTILKIVGVVILAIILVLIGRFLLRPGPIPTTPSPVPLIAAGERGEEGLHEEEMEATA